MGDIANMCDNDGRLNGHRLLKWLRSRSQMHWDACQPGDNQLEAMRDHYHHVRAALLEEMADDLERELTPPDYPADDKGGVWVNVQGCEDRYTVTGKPPDDCGEDGIDLDTLPAPGKVADHSERGSGV